MRAFRYIVALSSETSDCGRVPPARPRSQTGERYPLPREPGPLLARPARIDAAAVRDGGGDGVGVGGGGGAFSAVDDAAVGGASVRPVLPSCHRPQNFRDEREKRNACERHLSS